MSQHTERFATGAEVYDRFRPSYPAAMTARLAAEITAVDACPGAAVLDVGAGTGIFTRQLAAALPETIPIVGVEVADAMLAAAERRDETGRVTWMKGTAEALPATDTSARAVTAATAAHWFDRPRFYAECARALVPGGILAIIEYSRDRETSPAAAAIEALLRQWDEAASFARPDYSAELAALADFEQVEALGEAVALALTPDQFVGLVLSSSHARGLVAAVGRDEAARRVRAIADANADAAGNPALGYRFQLVLAVRRPG